MLKQDLPNHEVGKNEQISKNEGYQNNKHLPIQRKILYVDNFLCESCYYKRGYDLNV